jgi:hypothetical protein
MRKREFNREMRCGELLWDWLETQAEKIKELSIEHDEPMVVLKQLWPRWEMNGGIWGYRYLNCPACEAATPHNLNNNPLCTACPLIPVWGKKHGDITLYVCNDHADSPYYKLNNCNKNTSLANIRKWCKQIADGFRAAKR